MAGLIRTTANGDKIYKDRYGRQVYIEQPKTPTVQLAGITDSTKEMLGKYSDSFKPSQAVTNAQNRLNTVLGTKPGEYQQSAAVTDAQNRLNTVLGTKPGEYQQSEVVKQAQDYLNSIISGKPGDYQSSHKGQLDALYNQIMNRPDFSYDPGSDPMYDQYREMYMNLGQQAMMDTAAQAAALSGGYGSSYATTAGNQAYQAYLQQLNEVTPDLYQMALNRYNAEGQDLNNRYAMTAELENQEYARYLDELNKWQAEHDAAQSDYWNQYNADYAQHQDKLAQYEADRNYAQNEYWNQAQADYQKYQDALDRYNQAYGMAQDEYWNLYNSEYGKYQDERNYWQSMADRENAQHNADREFEYNQSMAEKELAYNQAMALLTTGKVPSEELLEKAGISSADAKALAKAYKPKTSSGSSSSSKKSSSSGSGNTGSGTSTKKAETYTVTDAAKDRLYSYRSLISRGEILKSEVVEEVGRAVTNGYITEKDGEYILNNL